jgi:hypothetical protein
MMTGGWRTEQDTRAYGVRGNRAYAILRRVRGNREHATYDQTFGRRSPQEQEIFQISHSLSRTSAFLNFSSFRVACMTNSPCSGFSSTAIFRNSSPNAGRNFDKNRTCQHEIGGRWSSDYPSFVKTARKFVPRLRNDWKCKSTEALR